MRSTSRFCVISLSATRVSGPLLIYFDRVGGNAVDMAPVSLGSRSSAMLIMRRIMAGSSWPARCDRGITGEVHDERLVFGSNGMMAPPGCMRDQLQTPISRPVVFGGKVSTDFVRIWSVHRIRG